MDPFSLTVGALSVVGISVGTCAKILHDVRSKYKGASLTIASITTECVTIQTALCQIESLTEQDPERYVSRLALRPDLKTALDTAITGCTTTFAVLEDELDKLSGALTRKTKAQHVWNEAVMQELLQQIRSQYQAISFLIMAVQSESITQCTNLLRDTVPILRQIAHQTQDLRAKSPRASHTVAESIFSAGSSQSKINLMNSTVGSLEFAFDDEIIRSKVYRRILAAPKEEGNKSCTSKSIGSERKGSGVEDLKLEDVQISDKRAEPDLGTISQEYISESGSLPLHLRHWHETMRAEFDRSSHPTEQTRNQLAKDLGVSLAFIDNWFQSRRTNPPSQVDSDLEREALAPRTRRASDIRDNLESKNMREETLQILAADPRGASGKTISFMGVHERTSVETYASTASSGAEEFISAIPDYLASGPNEFVAGTSLRESTTQTFSELFPSTKRLLIQHDDTTSDGNMNLRVETQVAGQNSETERVQLFHLRMHDLRDREFSLRRYCRSSGREVCHSVLKRIKQTSQATGPRRLSNAFSTIRRKASSAASSMASVKRTTSNRGSISSRSGSRHSTFGSQGGFDDEVYGDDSGESSNVEVSIDSSIIKLEFSNYACVEIQCRGRKSSKRYKFEYWGNRYTWNRVKTDSAYSFHLIKDGKATNPVAHIIPELRSLREQKQDEADGGWVQPCSMWIADKSVLDSLTDLAEYESLTNRISLN